MIALLIVALFAADDNAIVVLTPQNVSADDEQLVADVARELQLGGFAVTRVTTSSVDENTLRAELIGAANAHQAVGALRLWPSHSQIAVEVWGRKNAIQKLRRRDLPGQTDDERRVAALRAIELLRAVLLEVSLAAEQPQQAPVEMPPFVAEAPALEPQAATRLDTPLERSPRELRPNAWRAGIAAGAERFGDAPVIPTAGVSLGRVIEHDWLAELNARGGITPMHETRDGARLAARVYSAVLGIGPRWRTEALELGVLANGGVTALDVRGKASAPLVAHAATVARPTALADARITYWLGDTLWTRLAVRGGWVRPLDLTIGNIRAASVGPLTWGCELAIGFAWDSH